MAALELPEPFQDLAVHAVWALETEHERRAMRAASSMTDIQAFYDAMLGRLEEVLQFLSECPLDDPRPEVKNLFILATALAEIAPAIEMYGEQTAEGMDVLRLKPVNIYPERESA